MPASGVIRCWFRWVPAGSGGRIECLGQQQFLVLQRFHLLRTVKYNIAKIKEKGTIADRPRSGRPRKFTVNDSKGLSQWILRNKETTTSTPMNGLQKHFTLCSTNVNRKTERCTCTMGQSSIKKTTGVDQGSCWLSFIHNYYAWCLLRPNPSRPSYDKKPKSNLIDAADYNRIMIQNMKVG
ncbi:unnamed protein product [Rotaria magnacalcarata]|uniref:Uncharacterized protein n=1 Tax=Rotaria magnacalcarata TaxID=392030 RepID=A0A817ABB1_9BILA|nr:unnamed protein product [Rotaria magnacalcarata]